MKKIFSIILNYRYAFNGMEKDDEAKGNGNSYTTEFRQYDPRLGRWLSLDPEKNEFPDQTPYNNNANNPIVNADPNGDCPWCIGAIVGAVLDVGLQLTEIALDDTKKISDFSWTSVATSAASGAIGVGIATKVDKVLKVANLASKVTSTTIKIASNAATDAATSAASQKINKGKVDGGDVLIDVIAGGTAGTLAGEAAETAAKKTVAGKALSQQADRAARLATDAAKPVRQEASKKASEKVANFVAKRGAAAGVAASGTTSEVMKNLSSDKEKKK